jgi:hypothetical protein
MPLKLRTAPLLIAALLLPGPSRAEDAAKTITIQNESLRVAVDASGGFTVQALPSGKPFVTAGTPGTTGGTAKRVATTDATFGAGEGVEVGFVDGSRDLFLLCPKLPFLLVRSTLRNNGAEPRMLRQVRQLSAALDLGRPAAELRTLGTGGLLAADKNPGSYAWLAVADPATRAGVVGGWVTHDRGSGVVFSKVDDGRVVLNAQIDYGRLRIDPGKDAALETFALGWFDDARLGMEAWAAAVAKAYAIKLRPQPAGYCTWYSSPHGGASDEKSLAEQTAFAAQHLAPFGFTVMQIDDGWQEGTGGKNGPKKVFLDFSPKGPYPSGMKPTADDIKSHGLTPGIWFMPFAGTWNDPYFADHQDWFVKREDGKPYDTAWGGTCMDMTHPGAREYLRSVVKKIAKDWGYTYFKMDGMWTGTATKQIYVNSGYKDEGIGDAVFHDPAKTNIEAYRDGLKLVRETAGDGVFILGCCAPQNMRSYGGAFGLVDAMRIGPDNGSDWNNLRSGPLFASRNYHLHGRIWYNDPDPVYVRASVPIEHARFICSWVTVSGNLNLSSEWLPGLPADRVDLLKRTMPAHGLFPRPVDLFENEPARIWLLTDGRRAPRRDVVAIYNWESKALDVDVACDRLGLPPAPAYAAFDGWANAFLPPFKDRLQASLPAQTCRLLAVRPLLDRPFLISTSRHITQGIVDVTEETWDDAGKALAGKSLVVAGDPYELRVVAPPEPKSWKAVKAELAADDTAAGAEIKLAQAGPGVRATIACPKSRTVSWRIVFETGPAVSAAPAKVTGLAAKAPSFKQVVLTWDAGEGTYRVARGDGKSATTAANGYTDDAVEPGTSYTYTVTAVGWSGKASEGATVEVTVPKLELPPVPPAPAVHLSDLQPTKATTGWGQVGTNVSVDGKPLTVNGKKYDKGLGVHAASELVYPVKPEYKRFVAIAGLDDEKRDDERPSVVFQVWADRKLLAESPTLTWKTLARWHFDVPIPAKTKGLRLVVTDAGDGNAADHADWVEAGFVK